MDNNNLVIPEEVTGVIGQWLDGDTSELPPDAVKCLQKAYELCCEH